MLSVIFRRINASLDGLDQTDFIRVEWKANSYDWTEKRSKVIRWFIRTRNLGCVQSWKIMFYIAGVDRRSRSPMVWSFVSGWIEECGLRHAHHYIQVTASITTKSIRRIFSAISKNLSYFWWKLNEDDSRSLRCQSSAKIPSPQPMPALSP
jgi:hypothetical protein